MQHELDKKMLFNIMAIEKIDIELRMLKTRLKNPSILHSAQDFKKDVIQWMVDCSGQDHIKDELGSSSSSLGTDSSQELSALAEEDEGFSESEQRKSLMAGTEVISPAF